MKTSKEYLNEAKSKISSIETLLTEAHSSAEKSNNKIVIENAMKSLQEASNFINDFQD